MKSIFPAVAVLAALVLVGAVPSPDSATIENFGSTNGAPWTIIVRANAVGSTSINHAMPQAFRLNPGLAARFFHDLIAARAVRSTVGGSCRKSASFGSRTNVEWRGWTSPDLTCPPVTPAIAALSVDVSSIQAAAGMDGRLQPRLVPIPHELRRTEPIKTPRQGP